MQKTIRQKKPARLRKPKQKLCQLKKPKRIIALVPVKTSFERIEPKTEKTGYCRVSTTMQKSPFVERGWLAVLLEQEPTGKFVAVKKVIAPYSNRNIDVRTMNALAKYFGIEQKTILEVQPNQITNYQKIAQKKQVLARPYG